MYQQLKTLDPTEYYVCDCAQELLTHHPGKVKKIVCDLDEDWSFESGYFDFLSAFFVLEHIQDTEHFFDEAYRILRDQGQLLIGHFLQKRLFTRNINGKKFKIRQYPHTIEELEETAKRCGFQTGIMPLYDVCTPSLITGHLLVCEKHSLHPSSKVYSNN